jgi:tRNA G18 (ribose-2'-O)-methylase SpoU
LRIGAAYPGGVPRYDLESLEDARLQPFRALKKSNLTRWSGSFIAEGEKLVRRLLASPIPVDSVLAGRRWAESMAPWVPADVPLLVIDDRLVPELVGFNFHHGVLACGRRVPQSALAELVGRLADPATLVICPQIQNPENLGGVLRTSSAVGVDAVVLGRGSADPFSRRVVRVSMGTAFYVPIFESADLEQDLAWLRDRAGFQLVATVLDDAAEPLERASRTPRVGLLFGNEAHGLDPRWLAFCSRRVTIAMQRTTDSLNVAAACTVVAHHFLRVAGGG